jgi:predicted ATPase/class 3 adenylate cyclase
MMPELPRGTVTFLFTDIEGSTQRWERDRERMAAAVERHLTLLRQAAERRGGVVFKVVGDAVQAAFATAPGAVAAAFEAQRALLAADWTEVGGLPVRMALHAGEAVPDDRGDYLASPLNRLARLLSTGYGGQILLSQTVQQLTRGALPDGVALRDLGEHRLRDLLEPERIFQLVHPDLPADFPPLKSLDIRPHNLPLQPTPFLGREREVAAVGELVHRPEVRLLTLTGPGGTGKTRLALQAAADQLDAFANGVFVVPLAPLDDPGLVLPAIAAALGIREEGGQSLAVRLKETLAPMELLLVLDNVEHVVDAAPVVGELLSAAPGLTVLATSRVPLRLRAEREYPVPPLALPPRSAPPEQLVQSDAVRLFVERAQAIKPDFTVDTANAPAVAGICHRLDGLPLAIELAAARVRMLPPEALLARLEKRLPLLTGGARDAPARQQTLHNTIAWSYDLLDPAEQAVFRRLAVFAGGFTLDAAEDIAATPPSPPSLLSGIERLCEHSLLRQDEGPGGEPRFSMLETIHEFALERLAESGEEQVLRRAHASHFAALGDEVERNLTVRPGPFGAVLEADADNLRSALGWAEAHGEIDTGLRLGLAFSALALGQGTPGEARERMDRLLALDGGSPPLRARGLVWLGWLASVQGAVDAAEEAAERAIQLAADQTWVRAIALHLRGSVELDRGPSDAARQWFEEALELLETDPDAAVWRPGTLTNLGLLATLRGDFAEAHQMFEATLAALPADGSPFARATVLGNLAWVVRREGDWAHAAALQREALALHNEFRNWLSLAIGFEGAAEHAVAGGQAGTAAVLLGAADALRTRADMVIEPFNLDEHRDLVERTRLALGEEPFAAAWAQGEDLTLEDAISTADAVLANAAQRPGGLRPDQTNGHP